MMIRITQIVFSFCFSFIQKYYSRLFKRGSLCYIDKVLQIKVKPQNEKS